MTFYHAQSGCATAHRGRAGRILAERQRLGLTQRSAALACGVSREVWGRYERGQVVPGLDVMELFCQAGADPAYLLGGIRSADDSRPRSSFVRRWVAAAAHFFRPDAAGRSHGEHR